MTRQRAFKSWATEWENTRRKRAGTDSFAYEYALPHGPDGTNHPLWTAAVATSLNPTSSRRVPLFTRHTTSTALHLAVGHAFTAEYMRRFWLDLPLDELACPCGWPDASFTHLLYPSPRGHVARRLANPNLVWVDHSPITSYPVLGLTPFWISCDVSVPHSSRRLNVHSL